MRSTANSLRITRHQVPQNPVLDLDIIAGWNGNVGSYYFVMTWTKDQAIDVRAGDVCDEGGYPLETISDIADLASMMMGHIDLSSPYIVAVFVNLLADKTRDATTELTTYNPGGNKHLPDLIAKVLDKDLTPVIPRQTNTALRPQP
jgi:hypothetical protein